MAANHVDGTLHRALSPKPNSAYILGKNGIISFRAHWANDKNGLAKALAVVADGKAIRRSQSKGTMAAMMRMVRYLSATLDRAGNGAWRDMWTRMPTVAMLGTTVKVIGLTRRKQ